MKLAARFDLLLDASLIFANHVTELRQIVADIPWHTIDMFVGSSVGMAVPLPHDDGVAHIIFHFEEVENPLLRRHNSFAVQRLTVTITKDDGGRNIMDEVIYQSIAQEYRNSLSAVISPLIDYFRHRRGMPFLRSMNGGHQTSCVWLDERGTFLRDDAPYAFFCEFPGMPAYPSSLGSTAVKPSEMAELFDAITTPKIYTVADELRAQARDAIFEEKLLLAVLLLAVATEVAVKMTFFQEGSLASDAFDFLENKGKIEVSTVDMIQGVASRAFGTGFRDKYPTEYQHVEFLFRCRNKVAHRGKLEYSDGKITKTLDRATINLWWHSVSTLLSWLTEQAEHRRQSE